MSLRQLNVRVSADALDALEAAVFVRSLRSPQEIVGPVLEDLAARLMQDDAIKSAVELRQGKRERTNVTQLGSRPAPARGRGEGPPRRSRGE